MTDDILKQQLAYYRARAGEYDEWFNRTGRYDRGPEERAQWLHEIGTVRTALQNLLTGGHTLEFAGGTGLWTRELLKSAGHVTVIEAAPEMIAINRAQLLDPKHNADPARVTFIEADIFNWQPQQQYDFVFFGFWLSHVPPEKLNAFLALIYRSLKPNGRFFMVDSRPDPDLHAAVHHTTSDNLPDSHMLRTLNDGRTFEIIKVFYQPDELAATFHRNGLKATVSITDKFLVYASGSRIEKV